MTQEGVKTAYTMVYNTLTTVYTMVYTKKTVYTMVYSIYYDATRGLGS